MKIRSGFVSNSSSASFVLMTTVENWEKVKPTLNELELAVADYLEKETVELMGRKFITFATYGDGGSSWVEWAMDAADLPESVLDEDDLDTMLYDAWESLKKQVTELGKQEAVGWQNYW